MNAVSDNPAAFLLQRNIRPSYLRIRILQYLTAGKSHPTAEEIHRALVKEVPTLSRTTIYNTLKLFVSAGIVNAISIDGEESRYDAERSGHGHFKCERCGEICDFSVAVDETPAEALKNCKINERHIYYKGICPDCIKK